MPPHRVASNAVEKKDARRRMIDNPWPHPPTLSPAKNGTTIGLKVSRYPSQCCEQRPLRMKIGGKRDPKAELHIYGKLRSNGRSRLVEKC
jgi:hypothetical protein